MREIKTIKNRDILVDILIRNGTLIKWIKN
jgi:hypothetical protein